jgi:DNA-binding NarL/FixJ family response regulator
MSSEIPPLSPLERDILRLLARARTNREIQGELGLTPFTLSRVLSLLYRKSGVHPQGDPYTPQEIRARLVSWAVSLQFGTL